MNKELFVGQKRMQRNFIRDAKKGVSNFSVVLPNIVKNDTGEWVFDGSNVLVGTLEEFNRYIDGQQELMDVLKNYYPEVVSMIWRNAFAEFTGNAGSTIAGRLLNGASIKTSDVMKTADYYDVQNTMNIVLKAVSTKDDVSVKKADVKLNSYKKTNKEIASMLEGVGGGYFLPVVTENGCAVDVAPGKKLAYRFFAVSEKETNPVEVEEYLMMFSDMEENFEKYDAVEDMMNQAREAYRHIKNGSPSLAMHPIKVMTDYASILYRPDMSGLKKEKSSKKELSVEDMSVLTEDLLDSEFEIKSEVFEDKKKNSKVSGLVIEGNTNTQTSVQDGKLIATVTPENGMVFDVVIDDGRAIAKQIVEDENQISLF